MNIGDRVRVLGGTGKGHIGVIAAVRGGLIDIEVPALKMMPGYRVSVRRVSIEVLGPELPTRVANFRPYTPPRWSVPRAGSDVASRLPSVCGDQLVYPRGLQA